VARDVVTTWFGAFVLDDGEIVGSYPFPRDLAEVKDRLRRVHDGRLTPEEERLLQEHPATGLRARDRRLVAAGARPGGLDPPPIDPESFGFDPSWHREALLELAQQALERAWDPSIHIEEAVRALTDLASSENLLRERIESWTGRDPLVGAPADATEERPASDVGSPSSDTEPAFGAPEVPLARARQSLQALARATRTVEVEIERAIEEILPRRAPNLSALLGPLLAARMIAQAGGLDRLARLPSSTVQVLGAEKAFFEHLRGRAPPPRHGLLFLHPDVQSAPRSTRGKLARALAGKVAIAARQDREGSGLDPGLVQTFRQRVEEVRRMGPGRKGAGRSERGFPRSRPPLHRAALHR
jgi:nucleolar protein 56